MSVNAADFAPRGPWRNAHVQTIAGASPPRRAWVRHLARELRQRAHNVMLDAGHGIHLRGCVSEHDSGAPARGTVVLLHGWEGSVDSSYVLEAGARAFALGWNVVRFNLRDHGGSQALNRELFHSGRIDEVVAAVVDIARRWRARPLVLAGFSLGANFALRVALRAPGAGIALERVLAVAPVIDPAHGMVALETGLSLYDRYFMHSWRRSLRRKQRVFPQTRYFAPHELRLGMRELTRVLVERHTHYGTLERYLDDYSIAGTRLAALTIPAYVLAARDDPVIPIADFTALEASPVLQLEIADHGGHCAFLRGLYRTSFSSDWLLARMP